jgi:DNA-binding HxlR family transcriptional regulator
MGEPAARKKSPWRSCLKTKPAIVAGHARRRPFHGDRVWTAIWPRPFGAGNLKGTRHRGVTWLVTIRRRKAAETFDAKFPARRLLDLIGDKWTPIVLYCLSGGVRRFNEMQRRVPGISKKVLIQVLRSLERDGLVERTVYPVVPPKTEYRLTEDGKRLHAPVAALCAWAVKNDVFLDAVFARRDRSVP